MILKFLHIWLLCFSFSSNSAVSPATILPGSTLTAENPDQIWTSPNSTFSFRFITNVISNQETHFAAITYGDIPIWVVGGSSADGGAADSLASFQFVVDGNLRLVNGSDGAVVWQSNTAGRGVNSATLDDSGNFKLKNGTISVWSTFENPTDTLLPYQNFTVDGVLRSGLYSFQLLRTGNLALRWNNTFEYWNLGLNSSINTNLSSPTLQLQSNGIFNLLDPMLSTSIIRVYSSDYGEGDDITRFVKLDSDGNLKIYSSTTNGDTKIILRWAALSDQCQVFGYCGNMGICSYENLNPICGCPSKNFEPVEPKDARRGCRRKIELEDCRNSETMVQINHAQFLTYPPSSEIFTIGIVACRSNCLQNDACVASTSLADGTGVCYLKQPAFISGRQLSVVPSTSFVKVCGPVDPYPLPSSKKSKGWSFHGQADVVIIVGTILGLVMLEGVLCWFCCRNRYKLGNHSPQYMLTDYASGAPIQFSYKDLQRATKGFREKLGVGGFGSVYRGVLVNKTIVAVKQLEGIEQGEKQFRMEVATISNTHHLNLVRLIGFCSEGRHRLLVYEFLRNRSLDNFLFPAEENNHMEKFLNWDQRFNIALGTAKGITYLHEECRDCIVHCDIKPENILLDDSYNSKVSDFGLAKLVNPKDHRTALTSVRGTRGYLAPEWLADVPITSKSDTYSYGMVLLEIVSGRRNFDVSRETDKKKFSLWAYEEFEMRNFEGIIDKRLQESNNVDMEQIKRAIQVSFWCIQEQPSQRPTMGKVVQMLEGVLDVEKPPAPLIFVEGLVTGSVSAEPSNNMNAFSTLAPSTSNSNSSFQVTKNLLM